METDMDKAIGTARRVFGPNWKPGRPSPESPEVMAEFSRICMEHCFADSWSRPGLDLKTKSLVTLTVLTSIGATEELKLHVKAALNLGHSKEDIVELLIHLVAYCGVPRAVHAMRMARQAFAEADKG